MKSKFKIILMFLLAATVARGANKVGNGGNGVFCETIGKAQKAKAELLDFYEGNLSLEANETKVEVLAEQQFNKLKKVAPRLAELYNKRLKEIFSEIDFRSDISLTEIQDSEHLFQPLAADCKVLQVAIRRPKVIDGEKRFLFRKDLWEKLSPIHKAGLVTHEIIYEHFAKLGEKDSVKARKVNRFLYQENEAAESFWKLIKDLELPLYP